MTNKDYKRLTRKWETSLPTELTPCVHIHDRLWKLENAIEDGMLVFLPFKVGDDFWCFYYSLSYGWVNEIDKHTVSEIRIRNNVIYLYDENDEEYDTSDIILYFTKEAAEKALEELKKC